MPRCCFRNSGVAPALVLVMASLPGGCGRVRYGHLTGTSGQLTRGAPHQNQPTPPPTNTIKARPAPQDQPDLNAVQAATAAALHHTPPTNVIPSRTGDTQRPRTLCSSNNRDVENVKWQDRAEQCARPVPVHVVKHPPHVCRGEEPSMPGMIRTGDLSRTSCPQRPEPASTRRRRTAPNHPYSDPPSSTSTAPTASCAQSRRSAATSPTASRRPSSPTGRSATGQ